MESKNSAERSQMSNDRERLTNFRLLLAFMKGDPRIPDAFRWSYSIDVKMTAIRKLYEEILLQIPKCLEEFKRAEETGVGNALQDFILSSKYEFFLNSIYALCENLSNVVYQLYGRKVRLRFREQKEKFLDNKTIDSTYSSILETTNWYDEVNSMRHESTHFLSGLITLSSSTELGYFNISKNPRKGAPKGEIRIPNLEEHVRKLYRDVITFLCSYGDHFVRVINQNCVTHQTCYVIPKSGVGWKKTSLKEALNKEPGICGTPTFECPEKNFCRARSRTSAGPE